MSKNKIIDLLRLSEFKEKIVSLIPTKVSQLDNDSEYVTYTKINDLKKSVSDGKELVADAITDKGVDTAADATFATMAENIGKITTGGGEDTSDATAIPENVLKGETFYGKSGKQVGTMPNNGSVNVGLLLNETYTIPEGYHDGTGTVKVLRWVNTSNGSYKFIQNGDRWVANGSSATSTWKVTVQKATTAYIAYRTTNYNITINLNGNKVGFGLSDMKEETVVALNLVAGENTLTATCASYLNRGGNISYVVLPPIGEQPGQYKYQYKEVEPEEGYSTSVWPDPGYDGLQWVAVSGYYPNSGTPSSVTITGSSVISSASSGATNLNISKNFTVTLNIPLTSSTTIVNLSKTANITTSGNKTVTGKTTISGISFDAAASVSMISEHMGVDLETAQQMYNAKNTLFEVEEDELETLKVQKISETIAKSEKLVAQDEKLIVE